ncbi:unnamed protein product [Symbiodinium sp. CCMP2592]|nr:unnamed protein product [Symbiodinium sp. CCMP2592]
MLKRLQRHAAKFHQHANKSRVIRKYAAAAEHFEKAEVRQHTAHVAAWVAYPPEDRIPDVSELRLLAQLVRKLGSGPLPARLRLVLPAAQRSLRSYSSAGNEWEEARSSLQKRLARLRCCAESPPLIEEAPATATASSEKKDASGSVSGPESIFKSMNRWANMRLEEKSKCLEEAAAVVASLDSNTSQTKLSEVVSQAVGALAPPRTACQQAQPMSGAGEVDGCFSAEEVGPSLNLQRRTRKLLLKALRAWQSQGFDPKLIEEELCYLQKLFDGFEAKRGDLPGAASASVWLAIRQVVGELQQIEDDIILEVQTSESTKSILGMERSSKQAVMDKVMVALGGQATLKQLVSYVEQHPQDMEESEVLAKRLRRSGASDFFAIKGKSKDGQAIYGLAESRPRGVEGHIDPNRFAGASAALEGLALVLLYSGHVPVLGRVAELATSSLAGCFRGFSGGFAATGLEKLLKLYEFEGCPFCRNVRETISVLALDVEIYPCPRSTLKAYGVVENSRFREDVAKLGGKQMYPFLVDENTGVHMNESAEINAYLWKTYGSEATEPWTYWLGRKLAFPPLIFFPALCRPSLRHGVLRVPSKSAQEPLELWGCEGSPFVRLVREALCCLELPYVLRNVPHGEVKNRTEFREKYGHLLSSARNAVGAVQMPFLRDPNTGKDILESSEIVEYLYKTYQDQAEPTETWLDFAPPKKAVGPKAD